MRYFLFIISFVFLSACDNKKSTDVEKGKFSGKPQVTDALRGKTNPQILAKKYQLLKTDCSLAGKKYKNNQLVLESESTWFDVTPEEASGDDTSVVIDPAKPYELKYDLFEKLKTDKELKKNAEAVLVSELADFKLKLKINIKPVAFADLYATLVNAETGKQTLYLMKYSPIHDYGYSFELSKPGSVRIIGENDNKKIYEKVKTANLVYKEIVADETYEFSLTCAVNTEVNQNDSLKEEFSSQWCEAEVPAKPIEQQSVPQSVVAPIAKCKKVN